MCWMGELVAFSSVITKFALVHASFQSWNLLLLLKKSPGSNFSAWGPQVLLRLDAA